MADANPHIKEFKKAGAVKVGDVIMIDGRACKVIAIAKSKTGKHGYNKVRFNFEGGAVVVVRGTDDVVVVRGADDVVVEPPAADAAAAPPVHSGK